MSAASHSRLDWLPMLFPKKDVICMPNDGQDIVHKQGYQSLLRVLYFPLFEFLNFFRISEIFTSHLQRC